MQSEKYRQLVDRLVEKTDRRELDWKEGVYPDSFQVSFPSQSVVLSARQMNESDAPRQPLEALTIEYVISIVNESGSTVDEFSQFDLDRGQSDKHKYWDILETLYKSVRRQALSAEKVLDDLLSELA